MASLLAKMRLILYVTVNGEIAKGYQHPPLAG
jgi:hypothetical protein